MGTIKGLDCEVFKRTDASTYASPTYQRVDAVRNANYTIENEEVDATRRGSGGNRETEITLRNVTGNMTLVKDKDDPMFLELQTHARNKTAFEAVFYDGDDAAGSDGLDSMWKITSWEETQDLEDIVIIECTCKPTPDADLSLSFISDTLPTTR
ncbi:MAG: hypothetical protein AAF394_00050 [Planctomycetota bacterium]